MFQKNEFLRNISFSAHRFKQIKMQASLESFVNFRNDWGCMTLCQCTWSI